MPKKEQITVYCPNCNSDNVVVDKKTGYATLVSIVLFGLPLPFFKKNYYCFDCGNTWKIK